MAKARKKARKPAAKRGVKKTKRKTAKLKGRKVAKRKAKKRAAPPKQQGVIASAVETVTDTLSLRRKLEGPNTFED